MRTVNSAQDAIEPGMGDKRALEALEAVLARVPASVTFCLTAPDEAAFEIPEALYRALKEAVHILLEGSAVVISPLHRRLTTTEAGEILGVSRQYLTRLIDTGEIPCELIGRHRRLKLSDVLSYKRHRDELRRAALAKLTAEAAEMGAYD